MICPPTFTIKVYLRATPQHSAAPGIEISSGALGHGLSIGVGLAAAFARKRQDRRVFVLMGDGECEEGAVWEAAMFAPKLAPSGLVAIIDANDLQYQVSPSEICQNGAAR